MNIKLLSTCFAMALLGSMTGNVQAASIYLDPTTTDIKIGEITTLNIWADASDVDVGFLAGGPDVFVEEFPKDPTKIPVVTYNDKLTFSAGFPTDPAFSRTGDSCFVDASITGCSGANEINGIALGNFEGLAVDGPTLVGLPPNPRVGIASG